MSNKLSAVLIAGHSTQMKSPKLTLAFGEESVVARTLRAYESFEEAILVVPGEAPGIEDALRPFGDKVRLIRIEDAGAGIASQIKSGLAAASSSTSGFAIGLADQPTLAPDLVDGFASAFTKSKKPILVPVCQRSIGLPAFFDSGMVNEIGKLPPNGEVWDVIKAHGDDVEVAETYYTSVIRHIEDTEDYHGLLQLAGLPLPELAEDGSEQASAVASNGTEPGE